MLKFRQLTHGRYGHTLNRRQVLSPDGGWVVYDTRNDDSKIAQTDAIEMVHVETGEVVRLYTKASTVDGPGVGAVAFHPSNQQICFIHGLESCSPNRPYSAARRFGAILDVRTPQRIRHAESRSAHPTHVSRILGALSGGTHAHSWNKLGWLSFTYNDAYLEQLAKQNPTSIRDLRTVGFMIPGEVHFPLEQTSLDELESFYGTFLAFVAVQVTPSPKAGSDEIEQAVEECWLTSNRLAFQGATRDTEGNLVYEVFRCDLPSESDMRQLANTKLELADDPYARLQSLPGCRQTRLTRTTGARHPGVQGPRNWLVGSPDGRYVYFPMRDEFGLVQLCRVSSDGGPAEQVTQLDASIDGQISINANGDRCAFITNNKLCAVDLRSGTHRWLTESQPHAFVGAAHFLDQNRFVLNAYVGQEPDRFLQIFVCE
ncbi:MAG: DUF3748 domain-containing protein [Pirellula sp.]